jgi:hypothetical protein
METTYDKTLMGASKWKYFIGQWMETMMGTINGWKL